MGAKDAVRVLGINRGKNQINLVISAIVIPSEAIPVKREVGETKRV